MGVFLALVDLHQINPHIAQIHIVVFDLQRVLFESNQMSRIVYVIVENESLESPLLGFIEVD